LGRKKLQKRLEGDKWKTAETKKRQRERYCKCSQQTYCVYGWDIKGEKGQRGAGRGAGAWVRKLMDRKHQNPGEQEWSAWDIRNKKKQREGGPGGNESAKYKKKERVRGGELNWATVGR